MAINEIIKKAVQKPGLYWFIAPSYKQAKAIGWRLLKHYLQNDREWVFNEVELRAEHPKIKTRIELKGADNEDSLRGVGVNGMVLDECATMKANVWPEILRPMLADSQGWSLFIGTPRGKNWFHEVFTNEGKDPAWKSWKHSTTVNSYIPQEEIEAAKKDMSERLFRQEFMADFVDDQFGVFRKVAQCSVSELKDPVTGRFYVMGVDLAKHQDFTVITVMDAITRELVHFDRFNDISWPEQKERIQKAARRYNNAKVIIDSTGIGDAIYDDLVNANLSIEGYKLTNQSKANLIEKLSVAIEQRLITFPKIDSLISELQAFEYEITQEGRIKYGAPEGKHDDCVISLALANWGIRHDLYAAQILQDSNQEQFYHYINQGETMIAEEPGAIYV